jgi:ABC-type transporter MlaC component
MKIVIFSVLTTIALLTSTSAKVEPAQGKVFIEKLILDGISVWKGKPFAEQVAKFREVMETKFDLDGIAKRVLGDKLWKNLDEKQRSDYVAAFRQMLLTRYSTKFSNYGGQSIVVTGASDSVKTFPIGVDSPEAKPQVVVTSELRNSGGAPTKVEWFVGEENGHPTITDITLAGPSMVSTEQATFTAIQRNPENLKNAREACKSTSGAEMNKCMATKLTAKVMEYMKADNVGNIKSKL